MELVEVTPPPHEVERPQYLIPNLGVWERNNWYARSFTTQTNNYFTHNKGDEWGRCVTGVMPGFLHFYTLTESTLVSFTCSCEERKKNADQGN